MAPITHIKYLEQRYFSEDRNVRKLSPQWQIEGSTL